MQDRETRLSSLKSIAKRTNNSHNCFKMGFNTDSLKKGVVSVGKMSYNGTKKVAKAGYSAGKGQYDKHKDHKDKDHKGKKGKDDDEYNEEREHDYDSRRTSSSYPNTQKGYGSPGIQPPNQYPQMSPAVSGYQPGVTPKAAPYQPGVTPSAPYQPGVTPSAPYQPGVTLQPATPYQPGVTPQATPYQPGVTPTVTPYKPGVSPYQNNTETVTTPTTTPYQPGVSPYQQTIPAPAAQMPLPIPYTANAPETVAASTAQMPVQPLNITPVDIASLPPPPVHHGRNAMIETIPHEEPIPEEIEGSNGGKIAESQEQDLENLTVVDSSTRTSRDPEQRSVDTSQNDISQKLNSDLTQKLNDKGETSKNSIKESDMHSDSRASDNTHHSGNNDHGHDDYDYTAESHRRNDREPSVRRRDDYNDEPRSRRRGDYNDEPRSRRRDDYDDDPRSRRGDDYDDFDNIPRSRRRDDNSAPRSRRRDDYDDVPRSRRRDDYDDTPRSRRRDDDHEDRHRSERYNDDDDYNDRKYERRDDRGSRMRSPTGSRDKRDIDDSRVRSPSRRLSHEPIEFPRGAPKGRDTNGRFDGDEEDEEDAPPLPSRDRARSEAIKIPPAVVRSRANSEIPKPIPSPRKVQSGTSINESDNGSIRSRSTSLSQKRGPPPVAPRSRRNTVRSDDNLGSNSSLKSPSMLNPHAFPVGHDNDSSTSEIVNKLADIRLRTVSNGTDLNVNEPVKKPGPPQIPKKKDVLKGKPPVVPKKKIGLGLKSTEGKIRTSLVKDTIAPIVDEPKKVGDINDNDEDNENLSPLERYKRNLAKNNA